MMEISSIRGYVTPSDEWIEYEINEISEGKVTFRMVKVESIYDAPAFYNPTMVLNRDIALLFCYTYSKLLGREIRVFEPLAGIGIRGQRMVNEIPEVIEEVVINDLGDVSTQIAAFNNSRVGTASLHQFQREARSLASELAELGYRYHFIDLDPFGPPTTFIDSMWGLTPTNAMVSVTATDVQALCGVYPDACERKYGGRPLNNHHTHETAARLLIATVVRSAARFNRGVIPIFTSTVDHYVKVIFITTERRGDANQSVKQIGYSYTCDTCTQIHYIRGDLLKQDCCGTTKTAGPLWVGELFDKEICEQARQYLQSLNLPSMRRLEKQLEEGIEAMSLHGYYSMKLLGRKLRVSQPPFRLLKDELETRGYRFVQTRFTKQAFRSDIPGKELIEIIKDLVQ